MGTIWSLAPRWFPGGISVETMAVGWIRGNCGTPMALVLDHIGSYWIILDTFSIFPSLFHMVIASDCPSYGLPKRAPGLCRYRSQVVGSFWRLPRRRALCVPKGLCTAETASVVLVALVQSSLKFQSLYRIIYIYMYSHTFVQIISIYMYMNVSVSFVSKNHSKNLDDSFLAMWWDILCLRKSHQILRLSALRQFNRAKYGKWPIHLCHLSH